MANMGTLITVYLGHDIRDAEKVNGISMGVTIWKNGAHIGDAPNTAHAKNMIYMAVTKANEAKATQPATGASNDTPPTGAAKFPKRFENNPDDLI